MGINSFNAYLDALRKGISFLLISHVSPDGDTVGAAIALRLALLKLGKKASCICEHDIPASMHFLEGASSYLKPDQVKENYDTAVAVDVSAPELLGKCRLLFENASSRLVIDHHATNPVYGQINFIRGSEAACCQLAYETITALKVPIDKEIADALLLGLSTDTGHFQYSGTKPLTMRTAAELMEAGGNLAYISRMMYRTQPRHKVDMTRIAYEHMRFEADGQIGTIYLTKEDYASTGCSFGDADGLVNRALEVEGVRMAFLASERPEGIKMSLRAVEPDTVNDIAVLFGGGGHAQAAGCTIHTSLMEAFNQMLLEMKKKIEK